MELKNRMDMDEGRQILRYVEEISEANDIRNSNDVESVLLLLKQYVFEHIKK